VWSPTGECDLESSFDLSEDTVRYGDLPDRPKSGDDEIANGEEGMSPEKRWPAYEE
jgi:hypothetical protein